jgi:hypothetical protein
MSRPPRNDNKIYLKLHVNQGCRYARAQVPYITEAGTKRYKSVHFGTNTSPLHLHTSAHSSRSGRTDHSYPVRDFHPLFNTSLSWRSKRKIAGVMAEDDDGPMP